MHGSLSYSLQASDPQSRVTNGLYACARQRGQRGQLWASLSGRSQGLLVLGEVGEACSIEAQSGGGLRTVAISQIQGSESRAGDFDRDFNPLQDHTRERWLGIAAARQRGRRLPPVALIQLEDLYFVRDGHHRISVARALGQKAIEANVEVWQVEGPLSRGERSHSLSRRPAHRGGDKCNLADGSRTASILGWLSGLLRAPDRAVASQNAR